MTDPRYFHDCEIAIDGSGCIFLGQYEKYDLYAHYVEGVVQTPIARYGNDGPEYASGNSFVGKIPAITEAHRLAKIQWPDATFRFLP